MERVRNYQKYALPLTHTLSLSLFLPFSLSLSLSAAFRQLIAPHKKCCARHQKIVIPVSTVSICAPLPSRGKEHKERKTLLIFTWQTNTTESYKTNGQIATKRGRNMMNDNSNNSCSKSLRCCCLSVCRGSSSKWCCCCCCGYSRSRLHPLHDRSFLVKLLLS